MKKTTIFAAVVASSALALTVPDWNSPLNAQTYANPIYTITDAVVKQQLNVSGCKSLKVVTQGDVTLFEDGTYAFYRDSQPTWAGSTLSGTWAMVTSKSTKTVYLNTNIGSMNLWDTEISAAATDNCRLKYPASTVNVVAPASIISKNTIVVKVKNSSAKGTFAAKGFSLTDFKGPQAYSKTSVKIGLTGTFVTL
jgi:hypothetical protein